MRHRTTCLALTLLSVAALAAGCGSKQASTATGTTSGTTGSSTSAGPPPPKHDSTPPGGPGGSTGSTGPSTPPGDPTNTPTIRPFLGIADATVGNGISTATGKMGKPDKVVATTVDQGPSKRYFYGPPGHGLEIVTINGTITEVDTYNPADRDDQGVGPGSTQAQVKAAYPGVACDGAAGHTICHVQQSGTHVSMDFFIANTTGHVDRLVIGVEP